MGTSAADDIRFFSEEKELLGVPFLAVVMVTLSCMALSRRRRRWKGGAVPPRFLLPFARAMYGMYINVEYVIIIHLQQLLDRLPAAAL